MKNQRVLRGFGHVEPENALVIDYIHSIVENETLLYVSLMKKSSTEDVAITGLLSTE